ncbi:MAG: acylphosphatase [Ignavibacteriaceae bacterium]|nr:acylphosphatase [Ignavibacteriaceae bacterium]
MSDNLTRAEILASGHVQGVGFRYFVLREARKLGLCGYVENLNSGDVLTVVEGNKTVIEELFIEIKTGHTYAYIDKCTIVWHEYMNEFNNFEVRF